VSATVGSRRAQPVAQRAVVGGGVGPAHRASTVSEPLCGAGARAGTAARARRARARGRRRRSRVRARVADPARSRARARAAHSAAKLSVPSAAARPRRTSWRPYAFTVWPEQRDLAHARRARARRTSASIAAASAADLRAARVRHERRRCRTCRSPPSPCTNARPGVALGQVGDGAAARSKRLERAALGDAAGCRSPCSAAATSDGTSRRLCVP
jgi:hypothetical protein